MKYLFTVFFVFIIVIESFSQEEKQNIVELHKRVKSAKNIQEKIKLRLLLAENQYENDLSFLKK